LVYRDPWGNPYVITMDLNYDGLCKDAFYCLQTSRVPAGGWSQWIDSGSRIRQLLAISRQGHGLVRRAGREIDPNAPAKQGANKDNILSWK
jgi:hypothetical protein